MKCGKRHLVKSRGTVEDTLRSILKAYEMNRTILDLSGDDTIRKTIEMYKDFYDWLQGNND